ncbi:MAG: cytochrome C [Gammaproteobacteria bacterium]
MKSIAFNPKALAKLVVVTGVAFSGGVFADNFSDEDVQRWQAEYESVLKEGEKIFHGGLKNANTVSCDQCHPNGTNIHPETYPKFQQQLGKVAPMWEMINWCIINPLESDALPADDPRMTALQVYITHERRGVELIPGKH